MDELLKKHRLGKAKVERLANYTNVKVGMFACAIKDGENADEKLKLFAEFISHINGAMLDQGDK